MLPDFKIKDLSYSKKLYSYRDLQSQLDKELLAERVDRLKQALLSQDPLGPLMGRLDVSRLSASDESYQRCLEDLEIRWKKMSMTDLLQISPFEGLELEYRLILERVMVSKLTESNGEIIITPSHSMLIQGGIPEVEVLPLHGVLALSAATAVYLKNSKVGAISLKLSGCDLNDQKLLHILQSFKDIPIMKIDISDNPLHLHNKDLLELLTKRLTCPFVILKLPSAGIAPSALDKLKNSCDAEIQLS